MIPRLSEYKTRGSSINILPETWDISDVAEFLKINDCSTYCEAFIKQVYFILLILILFTYNYIF